MDQAPAYGWSLLEAVRELFPAEPHLIVLAAGLSEDPACALPPSRQLARIQKVLWEHLAGLLRSGELIARGAQLGQPDKETLKAEFFDAATAEFQAGTVTANQVTFGSVRLFRTAASLPFPLHHDHADAAGPESAAEPQPPPSAASIRRWYEARVGGWQRGNPIPTLDMDLQAAVLAFGKEHRTAIRKHRHELAPAEWKVRKTGKKRIPQAIPH